MCRSRSKGRGGAGSLCQAHAIEISSGILRRRTQAISPPGNDGECPAAHLKPYMLTAAWQVDIGFDNFPVAQALSGAYGGKVPVFVGIYRSRTSRPVNRVVMKCADRNDVQSFRR